ncbi:MAG: ABC transporter permease [Lachnospiraceae bacterium]|nr:ABC transporter permease [Lachnospiraceae bacterium]
MKDMKNLNYSLRYLLKNRGNSITRLISLALGLVVSLLICSYVGINLSYGRFFTDRERVYQIFENSPQFGITGPQLEPVAYTLAENIPSIEATTNYFDRLMQVKLGNSYMDARWLEVSEDFFTVLDFGVLSGDPKHILSREGVANNEVFITERLAELLFGSEDPLGKIVPTTQGQEYVVSGIFRTPPVTNPLDDFDIVSFRDYNPTTANWQGDDSYPTFIKLRKGATKSQAEAEIQRLIEEHPTLRKKVELWKANYFLVPIEDVVYVDNNIRQTQMIYGILAVLALLVATLNYVLLTLSSLVQRSRTIAMLRCNGASRWDIFRMLLSETLIMIVAAIVVAVFVIACLHQEIYQLLGYQLIDLFAWERIWIPALVCVVSFLVAGLIPASLYSRVSMSYAFRRGSDNRTWWKRILLFVQVACTTGVVCFLLTTSQQSKYILETDLGYDYDRIVTMNFGATTSQRSAMVEELKRLPFVESVGHSVQYPIWGYFGNPVYDYEKKEILFSCRFEYFDEGYIETMGMEIVAGRNFNEQDALNKTIVNEEFVRQHGWELESAVGKSYWQNGGWCEVVGVIRDFTQAGGFVEPLSVFRTAYIDNDPNRPLTLQMSIRLTELTPENIKALDSVIAENYHSEWEYQLTPYVDRVKERFVYRDSMRNNVLLVSLATLIISLIGLIGYLGNEMARRRKEIAIRKVNGATTSQVLSLLSLNISWVVIPAVVTGVAGAVWGGMKYLEMLETMCEPLAWWIFACGAAVVIAIVYVILIIRTWHTANANPIDMIKIE